MVLTGDAKEQAVVKEVFTHAIVMCDPMHLRIMDVSPNCTDDKIAHLLGLLTRIDKGTDAPAIKLEKGWQAVNTTAPDLVRFWEVRSQWLHNGWW